jgi:hypothetical protein
MMYTATCLDCGFTATGTVSQEAANAERDAHTCTNP